ncbi:hypothetical protein EGW08_011936 [Elysia chlorotica]|uniref:Peptidase S1 domain-containing protein n=1 Tax=Elysia chlorotica TaxID=188477 RepID=A0A3S1BGM8_ELYCH|nr:hypothetical protein EGW08_011936 [Elysia chlorotica]
MGNKKSAPRIQNHDDQDESDYEDDDDEPNVILEIEERAECDNVESLSKDCERCEHLYGSAMIDVKDFSLDCLPEALREQQILDYLMTQAKIAVKLQVKKCGFKAGMTFDASGWACVSEDTAIEYASCPLQDCPMNGGNVHKAYGGITVYTNEHVVNKKEEGVNCKIIFFYVRDKADCEETFLLQKDSPDTTEVGTISSSELLSDSDTPVLAWGLCVKQVRENKDLVAIETIFHDPELFNVVSACSTQRICAWTKMPDLLKKELKEHVVVISHPHGRPKVVSVGKLLCLEEASQGERAEKETRYSASTCTGSSGGPVICGHYPYRPFTHSSKREYRDRIENFSLSY